MKREEELEEMRGDRRVRAKIEKSRTKLVVDSFIYSKFMVTL